MLRAGLLDRRAFRAAGLYARRDPGAGARSSSRRSGLHRIEAACLPSNEPSKNLLIKMGFRQEGIARRYLQINGEWQDHVLFALLADEVPSD